MATIFTFPKSPRVGDRIEIVSTSTDKMPINIVANAESDKPLELIYPNAVHSGNPDGITTVTTIEEANILYSFRCVSTKEKHVWLLENDAEIRKKIAELEARITVLEGTNAE